MKPELSEAPTDSPVEGSDANGTPPPPSFKNHLKLQDFLFTGSGLAGLRRSPRLSTTPAKPELETRPPITTTTPKSSPTKRKALSLPPSDTSTPQSSPSPSKKPKRAKSKSKSSYAPPSTYAHLAPLPDAIGPNLLVLFIGLNPGIQTARTGHAYAHPTNLFWRLLHSSGVTPRLCSPTEDRTMPSLYSLGLTNIVSRPSRNGAELSKEEMDAGVAILEAKARRWRPESMCVVGKSIWESLWRVRHGRAIRTEEFRYGWQEECENMGRGKRAEDEVEEGVDYSREWKGARVFVASSTSGLAATLSHQEKQRIWRELGSWVEERREQRAAEAKS